MAKSAKFRHGVLSRWPLVTKTVTLWGVLPAEYEQWARQAAPHFAKAYGLASSFALPAARLYVALWGRGLAPRVTRGWTDPARQAALRARWDAGDRAGLRVRPAAVSKHTETKFLGSPSSLAIDMPCNDDATAAAIAANLGLGTGWTFKDRDPGHYFQR